MTSKRVIPRWISLPFLLIGAYIVLVSLDLLPYTPNPRKRGFFDGPQHWQITGLGITFFCAGLSMLVSNRRRWLSILLGAFLLIAFMSVMVWFFYFSGRVDLPMQVVASIPLALGSVGGLLGLIRTAQGKPSTTMPVCNPEDDAGTLAAYGRTVQAEAIMQKSNLTPPVKCGPTAK